MDTNLLMGVSLTASFLAGVLALFAPCCITFLLPSYLGTIFKERKHVMYYTVLFALGLGVVLVPIALGFRGAIYFLDEYHTIVYYVGALMMLLMAATTAYPILHLPQWFHVSPDTSKKVSTGSIFSLGVMSGLTTACCAPVLLAAVTLTALSPTLWQAAIVAMTYVAGIVMPLVLLSYGYERWSAKIGGQNRQKIYKVLRIIGTILFALTGILIAIFNYQGKIVMNQMDGYNQWMRMRVFELTKMFSLAWVDTAVFVVLIITIYLILQRRKTHED